MSDASSLPDPSDWEVRYSAEFQRQLGSRQYRSRREEVLRRLDALFGDVYRAGRAERLRGRYRGLRSARVDDRVRFIYRLCEECRREGEQDIRPLDCCISGDTDDRTVNVLLLSDHYADIPEDFAL